MYKRLVNFLEQNNSLYENQYGFRAGRSCEHALLNAKNTISDALNKNQVAVLLLIDFSKAFDMVDHDLLLSKLSHYGIRGNAHRWLTSYLSNREQYVCINGIDSNRSLIKYGVPQGSILGPLLFVIYINDIPNICKLAKFILYADDANIIITGKNITEIKGHIYDLITKLVNWVNINGLVLNLKKTNYMIFSRQRNIGNLNLVINNVPIELKSEARFLGVIIDDKLNFRKHINALKAKMSRYIGVMYKLKFLIPIKVRLLIYHSFIQSHLNFCSLVWGFAAKSFINELLTIQKKAIRAVMPGYIRYFYKDGVIPTHTKTAFNDFNILTVHNIIAKTLYCL